MGLVLSIYTKRAFKEFILPSINNADYAITLRKNYFEIEDDLQLNFEIINGIWHLLSGKNYSIVKNNESKSRVRLENSDVITIQTVYHEEISVIVKEVVSSFQAYKKYVLQNKSEITIGKESNNDICYDFLGMVSRKHAKIFCVNGEYYIENKSPNGVYVDSVLVNDKSKLKFGSFINIIGLHMVFLGDLLAIDQEDNGVQIDNKILRPYIADDEATMYIKKRETIHLKGKTIYHRAPRKYEKVSASKIEIEFPPMLNEEKKQSLFMSVGPSITMALPMLLGGMLMLYSNSRSGTGTSLYMYSGLIMSVTSATIGVMWTLINRNLSKKNEIEKKEYRFKTYSEYLVDKATEIKEKYEETIKILEDNYPKAKECLFFDKENGKMWSRNETHEDFLCHRLGLGNKEFQCDIEIPKKQFSLYHDDLLEKPEFIKNDYRQLIDVPITVDLMEKQLLGIVGGKSKKGAYKIVELLSSQIAFNNCYTDVKLVYIYNSNRSDDFEKWNYAKWLPHVWSEDKKTRFVAGNKDEISDVLYEIKKILRNREDMAYSSNEKKVKLPYYIMFVSDASLLEGEEFSKYIYSKEKNYGITAIFLADCCQSLPNECDFVIENTDDFKGMYDVFASENEKQRIVFDEIDESELENSARRIANYCVPEVEKGGEIPTSINFFEMLRVNRIEEYPVMEMWTKNRTYENIRGLLGQKAGGSPCYLDVHEKYHGPHGLIAGTTGSGKSETLQSYILSLAINYSPDDIGFFIIDYKGGGMANLFEGLPHLIGQISNLSGNQVKRAMISIKSENKRRQRMFVEHGVNNINAYTKMYKNGEASAPIPHLFIVIDEFAELKKEEPEFMKELISVAQVGRSLGVHLILSTQKPSGTVDDNIWSNSKFRLCLRVQDQQDSKDMLHKVDAAYITQAGRGYLQVGNDEVYEMFQSGFSGAVFDENMISNNKEIVKLVTLPGKIDMSGNSVRLSQKRKAEVVWIDTLCKCLEKVIVRLRKMNKNILSSDFLVDVLVKELYIELENVTQDYVVNEYNTARLKDFITIYLKTFNIGNDANNAENIIKIATKIGIKLPQTKEKTQLDVTISYLARLAKKNGYAHKLDLWLPILPETIYLQEFDEFSNTKFDGQKWIEQKKINISVVIGKVDDPENQSQFPMIIDFLKDGNIAICGNIVSGRSTLMQTMVYSLIHKYNPSWLNLYVLDFSSRMLSGFESAPHIGAVMYENELEKISKFFNMMMKIYIERKELYQGGNYKQYVGKNGVKQPVIIVFVDNYSAFKEKTQGLYEDIMVRLTKDGISLGIYFVISGTTFSYNDISNRISENIGKILCLSLPDKYAYGELLHNMQINVTPENGMKGRGLAYFESRILEYQVALSEEAENDYQRLEKIKTNSERMAAVWKGKWARRVPEIPENPVWSKFSKLDEYNELLQDSSKLPVGYDKESADVYGISLDSIYCYLITGLPRTGKSNYMKVMIQSSINKNSHVCIIDSPKNEFKAYGKDERLYFLSTEQQIFEYFRDTLTPVFQQRNQKKNSMLNDDCDEVDIYNEMRKETPYFIFISDFSWFVKMIYTSTYEMKGFMETLVAKGRLHNIYFVAELALNKSSECRGYKMYESFIEYRTGIHFGGRTAENSILPFEYLSYKDQSEEMAIGVGKLPGQSNYKGVKNVIIPMARK